MEKRLTTNLGLKVLAFLIAVFMWLIVVNIDDPITEETFTGIPVTVINEEIVTNSNRTYQIVDNTQEVSVIVSAKRSVLNRIKADDIVATADMKELTLDTQIPIQVKVKGYQYKEAHASPSNLQVKIDDEAKNNFPITPTAIGTVREGYVIGELNPNPEKITFRGPKSVINSISKVVAEVDVSGLSEDETLEARLVLYDANNNVVDQTRLTNNLGKEGVSVDVELYQVKSIPIKVDDSQVTAAEGYKIGDISVEPQEVTVTGERNALADLSEIDIPAEALKSEGLTERTEIKVDISSYLPEDVSLVDENANNVVVSIAVVQPGAKTFEVATNSITINNLNEDLDVGFGTTVDLEIQIRGPSEALEVFSIAKKVSIDLKDYNEPGTYTVPVEVGPLPEGCSLVGDLSVEVILDKK